MMKVCGLIKCRTPSKSKSQKVPGRIPLSPAQSRAKKVTLKYKRGYRKSPGKVARIREALTEIENGISIRKTAKNYGFSESFLRRRVNGEVKLDSRNGPNPVFTCNEECEMAKWLSEMSKRGMGLGPADFLDFVQAIIKKEKRHTGFINDRPSYTWYYSFMARNSHLVEKRQESVLENSRAKVTAEQLDKWFTGYYKFLSELHLLDKSHRVYNADESGFSMGSKASVVIGPPKKEYPDNLPHLCGQTKKRLTGMFCANAEGEVIPPFLVYPQPKPTAYDPLIGSRKGTVIEYTEKGWMNGKTFMKFLKHFDQYASQERPVVLLVDSVSSHIDLDIFTFAKEKQIELYRLIPNATHFLQPLDNGVFGPLKKVWYKVVRKYTKENPGKSIGKENFAGKLHEAFMQFYKPLTVSNSFRSTGIHPVDRSKISENKLKPALTFQHEPEPEVQVSPVPVLDSYVEDHTHSRNSLSGLALLADIALIDCNNNVVGNKSASVNSDPLNSNYNSSNVNEEPSNRNSTPSNVSIPSTDCGENVSLHLKEALVFPSCSTDVLQKKRKSTSECMPDCLTSSECIRSAALKKLESVRKFARKEIHAKTRYMKEKDKKILMEKKLEKKSSKLVNKQNTKKAGAKKSTQATRNAKKCLIFDEKSDHCVVCKTVTEDELGWVQCDLCDSWMHVGCIPAGHDYDKNALSEENIEFFCHICVT